MAFSEMGTFHLCFTLNWNKLINVIELCFTTDLSKQKAAFLMCSENRLSQISLSSKDSGVKEVFYHYMLLNPKELAVSFLPLCSSFSPEHCQTPYPWHLVSTELSLGPSSMFPDFFSHIFHFFIFCTMKFSVPCLHSESVCVFGCVSLCWFYQSYA